MLCIAPIRFVSLDDSQTERESATMSDSSTRFDSLTRRAKRDTPWWLTLVLLVILGSVCLADDDTDARYEQQVAFFETKIRPLLVDRCYECHDQDTQEGALRLDTLQGMVDGGDRGPAIIPGEAKNSLLMHAVNHTEVDLQMPEGDKLGAHEIANLAKWIDEGAIWPGQRAERTTGEASEGALFTAEERSFWAFQDPQKASLPGVQHSDWIQSPIDAFVLQQLEAANLEPAPPATKRHLLRRVYIDLIGLPPRPEQVAAFLADTSPGAWERVIDELLASPQYGERWGRHWLDVARYADSNGLDENWAFEHIYQYRDWVIDAFNQDLPYDDFVRQQIAGDLIEQQPSETQQDYIQRVIATGFLSVGPKMIADDDPKKKKMDIVDEQLNTVSQTFMALTVGCARCHDHKFDPIPAWDYYAMAGIFKSTRTMEHLRVVAPVLIREFEPAGYTAAKAKYDAEYARRVSARDRFWRQVVPAEAQQATDPDHFQLPDKADDLVPAEHRARWSELRAAVQDHAKTEPRKIKVMAPSEGEPENLRVSLRGNYLTLGAPTKRQFLRIIEGEHATPLQTKQSGRLELANWLASVDHPLTARVMVNRVWRWRFGRGIVSTPDNFGKLGARPTHPELLDWLAVTFMEDGWSLKRLHKRMLLSSTYQMSTQGNPQALAVDPENFKWWRFPRQRMEAEVLRDTLLRTSDRLDLTMGGSLMTLKDRTYVTGTASKTQNYENLRRSVYQPVYRSAVYDVLTAFDFPDPATPSGDRHTSIVAPQALLMMNSPLMREAAAHLAQRILARSSTVQTRVADLYAITLSRSPTKSEQGAIQRHVNRTVANTSLEEAEIWQGVCRVLLSTNEFLYLD